MIGLAETVEDQRAAQTKKTLTQARTRLEENPAFRGHSQLIHMDEQDGILVLHGRLPSYYLKQILQTTLGHIDGITEIDNQVEVLWPNE